MATFLAEANEVLLMVGEREVASFTSPTGKKTRLALRRAINMCAMLHSWRFLRMRVQPSSLIQWSNSTVTLPPFTDLLGVNLGINNLSQGNPRGLVNLTNLSTPSVAIGTPTTYSIIGDNQVIVWPMPSDVDKLLLTFDIVAIPTLPSLPTDEFAFPSYFTALCSLYAQYVMHLTHTTDLAAADATMREFEMTVQTARTKYSLMSTSNMAQ